jgi:4-alpha-glucanotransferase
MVNPNPTNCRRAGLLVHPTSLPGSPGIGDAGDASSRLLDRLVAAGCRAWQVLPLGPSGPGDSPYSALSAFAGNPLLISPQRLEQDGWLPRGATADPPKLATRRVEFAKVSHWKTELLHRSWDHFKTHGPADARRRLGAFVEHEHQATWLADWTLFAALRRRFAQRSWIEWDRELRLRQSAAVDRAQRELAEDVAYERYLQFVFDSQWKAVRRAAADRGVEIVGDAPYYVAMDSADVWAHRELFKLDGEGRALQVAGVPPDYFSKTGQLWGNPVYDWDRIAERGYRWWIDRVAAHLRQFDRLRLDHFRGFAAFWEVDAGERTAVRGRWTPGPGAALFHALSESLSRPPLIAEDLGMITDDVNELRDALGLPGMRVLQFAFDDDDSPHLPENHATNSVVYTGTHDNDTTRGWFDSLARRDRERVLDRLDATPENVVWRMIETAYQSKAELVVVPLQDPLELGSRARMNRPGVASGNWTWRAAGPILDARRADRLRELARQTGRASGSDAG